ncbi:MAG TPA: ureidoglycolate lyase [Thermodesulfobacteriota bacterium]|nr:ureidoglycolate lyase [Thermodesulfobacteriota bacterium]
MMGIEEYLCLELLDFSSDLGQIIRRPAGKATFNTEILSYWDGIASWEIAGKTGIGWFELKRRPYTGNEVERHLLTPEALLCHQGGAACLVGKPKDPGTLTRADFQAFFLESGQGIVFSPGVWHALPFPVTAKAVFWVIFRQGTAQNDLEVLNLEKQSGIQFQITF